MAVFSHDPERPPTPALISRPPGIESRRCEGKSWVPGYIGGARWVDCTGSAVWAITEVSYCHHHLPTKWFGLAQQRRTMWLDYAAELWQDIVAETTVAS